MKFFKNGAAQVNYTTSKHDKFPLKIIPKSYEIPNIEAFFKDLKTEGKNTITLQADDKESGESISLPIKNLILLFLN